jgi:hypothetical protein
MNGVRPNDLDNFLNNEDYHNKFTCYGMSDDCDSEWFDTISPKMDKILDKVNEGLKYYILSFEHMDSDYYVLNVAKNNNTVDVNESEKTKEEQYINKVLDKIADKFDLEELRNNYMEG